MFSFHPYNMKVKGKHTFIVEKKLRLYCFM